MPNVTRAWDRVPVWGRWLTPRDLPIGGAIAFTIAGRLTRLDGTAIYPGDYTEKIVIGNTDQQDPVVRNQVRQALRDLDEAAAVAAGTVFDGSAWDVAWEAALPGAIFTSFPAVDDPDIVQSDFQVLVKEQLNTATGKTYTIETRLTSLPLGVNLNLVEVPPGTPNNPAPVYAKSVPGGVAALDEQGFVINADGSRPANGPDGGGLQPSEAMTSVVLAPTVEDARVALGAGTSDLELGETDQTAKRGDWVPNAGDVIDLELFVKQTLGTSAPGGTMEVFYRDGAWVYYPDGVTATPLPTGVPAGVRVRHFYGPVQHVGDTPTGVVDKYSYTELT